MNKIQLSNAYQLFGLPKPALMWRLNIAREIHTPLGRCMQDAFNTFAMLTVDDAFQHRELFAKGYLCNQEEDDGTAWMLLEDDDFFLTTFNQTKDLVSFLLSEHSPCTP